MALRQPALRRLVQRRALLQLPLVFRLPLVVSPLRRLQQVLLRPVPAAEQHRWPVQVFQSPGQVFPQLWLAPQVRR